MKVQLNMLLSFEIYRVFFLNLLTAFSSYLVNQYENYPVKYCLIIILGKTLFFSFLITSLRQTWGILIE